MTLRRLLMKLSRNGTAICICGVIICIIIMISLTFCNTPCDSSPSNEVKSSEISVDAKYGQKTQHAMLVVVVMTAPDHFEARTVTRETWAKDVPANVAVRFVIGAEGSQQMDLLLIREEQKLFKDLILLKDLKDSYNSLTKKLILTLEWVDRHFEFTYLMKVDDDSYVRLDKIVEELKTKQTEQLYWGFFDGRAHVKKSGKWAELEFLLCDRYLPYAVGGGYVITSDLVKYVASNSKLLQQFNSEDVSLGVWLSPLDIYRAHDPNFNTEFKSRGCMNSYLVMHKQSTTDFRKLHSNLGTFGRLCETEVRERLSYVYDWTVLPTKCCQRTDPLVP